MSVFEMDEDDLFFGGDQECMDDRPEFDDDDDTTSGSESPTEEENPREMQDDYGAMAIPMMRTPSYAIAISYGTDC